MGPEFAFLTSSRAMPVPLVLGPFMSSTKESKLPVVFTKASRCPHHL